MVRLANRDGSASYVDVADRRYDPRLGGRQDRARDQIRNAGLAIKELSWA